jgi:hypothetical protein
MKTPHVFGPPEPLDATPDVADEALADQILRNLFTCAPVSRLWSERETEK